MFQETAMPLIAFLAPDEEMLAGLITYSLLAIYCHDQHQEKVSVKRLRKISINIRNEMSIGIL
jgi:hypothetical protein